MSDARQTVAGAYAKIISHEDLCALRYAEIAEKLGDLKTDAKSQHTLLWSILLSFAGFMAVTLVAIVLNSLKLVGN